MLYNGICVGGPLAGQNKSHTEKKFDYNEAGESPILTDKPMDQAATVNVHRYVCDQIIFPSGNAVWLWVHGSIGTMERAMAELTEGYSRYIDLRS